jgi:hypothetical protein
MSYPHGALVQAGMHQPYAANMMPQGMVGAANAYHNMPPGSTIAIPMTMSPRMMSQVGGVVPTMVQGGMHGGVSYQNVHARTDGYGGVHGSAFGGGAGGGAGGGGAGAGGGGGGGGFPMQSGAAVSQSLLGGGGGGGGGGGPIPSRNHIMHLPSQAPPSTTSSSSSSSAAPRPN